MTSLRTRPSVPPLLRERTFRRFWTGHTISLFGDQITLLALPLTAVLVLHAGAAQMGYLGAAALVPNLLFSLHAGALVDRRGRRRQMMIAADIGRAVLLATIPLASVFDRLTLGQLYVVAFLVGTLSVLFSVSDSALFVAIVPRERYVEGNSLIHGSRAFSFVGGPSLGGLLVQLFSAPLAILADALSFVTSALFLSRISPVEPPRSDPAKGHVSAGLRFVSGSPIVRAALAATATINLFNFMFWAIVILYVTRTLHVRPGVLGLVLGSAAVGSVIGSFVTGWVGRRIGIGGAFVLGCVLFPLPLLLVPAAGGPHRLVLAMLFVAELFSGLGVMILDISIGSIFAAVIPHELRSRVSGAYMLVNYGIRPIGALLGGGLGAAIGLRPTLWLATAGALLGVLWLVRSPVPKLRVLPETPE